jgi:hypothetical protein
MELERCKGARGTSSRTDSTCKRVKDGKRIMRAVLDMPTSVFRLR